MRVLLLLTLTTVTWAQEWKDVLAKVRRQVAAELEKTDNYTCVETIERRYWYELSDSCKQPVATPSAAPSMSDRLRLDVAVANGGEIFSWHGESEFTSTDISEVVRDGPSASGSFVGYLRNVFLEAGVVFVYRRRGVMDGSPTYEFDFKVNRSISRYRIEKEVEPFHGSFSVDAATLRLLSVVLIPDEHPESTKICAVNSMLNYAPKSELFVPESVVLLIAHSKHFMTESRMRYSSCRAFGSESTIRFDAVDENATAATSQAQKEKLPAGVRMRIALNTVISDDTAYAGDAVEGVLAKPLKLMDRGEMVPAGTQVHGVIKRLESQSPPAISGMRFGPIWRMRLEFDRFAYQGKVYVFRAQLRENRGETMISGEHFKLGPHYTAEYQTIEQVETLR